ncbi:MAG: YeeE/YedE family protein [Armatimonadota bacterium]|nr:YeeE/YedE family protein [Armatimonadota bacterium]MDR5702569.1 YeeE/YedE family protein [Armatimonadota bacterium]MDR7433749.1 YeeE/YedE family protein [Armatimonadota bacterium]
MTLAGVVLLALAGVAGILLTEVGREVGLFWAFGLAFGFVLQRSRFCFASAFRDLFLFGSGRIMKGILAGMAVATLGFAVLMSKMVPNPLPGVIAPEAHVVPVGIHLILGGILFGFGMVQAGGCISGSLYRIGEGYVASWVAFGGILGGLGLALHSWNWWWRFHIGRAPMIWIPSFAGYAGATILTLFLLLCAYLLILWWESTKGVILPEVPAGAKGTDFLHRLQDLWEKVFRRGWPVVTGGVTLGVLNILLYVAHMPWGITGEISRWAAGFSRLAGFPPPALLGVDQLAGCTLTLGGNRLITHTLTLDVGMVAGSLIGALLAGEFRIRIPPHPRRYAQAILGGILMGYGAGIAMGCTIGAFFSAIPSLGLNGWVFGLSLLAGAYGGVQVLKRIP